MRVQGFVLLLLSCLVLYTISAPIEEQDDLTNILDAPVFVKSLLPGRSSDIELAQPRALVSTEEDIGLELEKRKSRKGGSRSRTKKPSRKRPQKKKKKTTQKKKKPSTKKPKKPANGKPTTKKPKKPKKQPQACKLPNGKKGKNGKLSARAGEPSGASCPPQKVKRTQNYKVAQRAARKAGQELKLHHAYLLRFKSQPGIRNHQMLVVGYVKHRTNPPDGALDFEATSSELVKPMRVPTTKIAAAKQKCLKLHGAKCKHRGIEKTFQCKQTLQRWGKQSEFIFKGGADPEFVKPGKFVDTGKQLLEKDTTYDIVYNNCGTHARKMENVAQLKEGQDPLVDIELEEFADLSLSDSD